MTVPTTYTDETLADFFRDEVLKRTATLLGWSNLEHYQGAITDTLIAYGVSSIADAADIPRLRAIGRREVWRAVVEDTAGMYAYTVDGETYNRQQINAQARLAYEQAAADAEAFEVTVSESMSASRRGSRAVPVRVFW